MFFAVEVFSVILANGLSAPHDSILVVPPPPPPPPPPPAPPGTLHGLLRLPAREAFKSLNETGHFHPSVPRKRAATRAGLNGARPRPAFHFANMLYLTGTVRVQTLPTLEGVAWHGEFVFVLSGRCVGHDFSNKEWESALVASFKEP